MYKNKPLYWEHGTLLQPQHFQLLDQKASYFAKLFTDVSLPHAWGFKRLELSQEAFANQSIVIESLEFISREGDHIVLGKNASIPPRSFSAELFTQKSELFVYLTVPMWDNSNKNVTECDTEKNEHYSVKSRFYAPYSPSSILDLHANGPAADIRFISFTTRITWETETDILENSHAVPIARIVKDGDSFLLDVDYTPPCVDIFAFSRPSILVQNIKQVLHARLKQLEEYKLIPYNNENIGSQPAFTTYSLSLYFMLGALSRALPKLEHLCQLGSVHPWFLYGMLREILGELSMFSSEINCLGVDSFGESLIPEYNHTDIGACFLKVHDLFVKLTAVLITGPAHTFLFHKNNTQFLANIPVHVRSLPYAYWLQVRTGGDISATRQNILQRAKLAHPSVLPTLVTKSLSGINLLFSEKSPSGLPRREDTLYFFIDIQNQNWQQVLEDGELALFMPQVPEDMTVQLILIKS